MPLDQSDQSLADMFAPPDTDAWSPVTDIPRAVYSGVEGLGASAESGLSYLDDKMGYADQAQQRALTAKSFREAQSQTLANMTPGGQQSLNADVTSSDFLSHPFRSIALKGAQMSPVVVAAALPGGIVGEALGATAGVATAGAVNAGLSSAQFIDSVASKVDGASDDDLQKQSAYYTGLRQRMEEPAARDEFRNYLVDGDGGLALNALIGGVTGAVGLGGMVARGGESAIAGGIARRATLGGLEAGGANAAQSGVGNFTEQSAGQTGGFQGNFDPHQWTSQVLEGFGLGAIPGMAHSAFHRSPVEVVKGQAGDAAQTSALSTELNGEKSPNVDNAAQPKSPGETPQVGPPVPTPSENVPSKVTPPEPPAPISDVGQNAPEAPATLNAQQEELTQGKRQAVLYPKGTTAPDVPEGMKQARIKEGIVHFDPDQLQRKDVIAASTGNKLNELLGLGPANKDEVQARVAQGEPPVAVTERQPDGTETKAAVGTTETAPDQVAALEAQKQPGNTVQVEAPQDVLAQRDAANKGTNTGVNMQGAFSDPLPGKIFQDQSPEAKANARAQQKVVDTNLKDMQKAEAGPQGKNWTLAEKAARTENAQRAQEIFDAHKSDPLEYVQNKDQLKGYQDRLQNIVDEAKAKDVTIPSKVGYEGTSDYVVWLADVKRVLSTLKQRKGAEAERMKTANDLLMREMPLREGDASILRSERRAEGEAAKRQYQGDVEEKPEATLHNPGEVEDQMLDRLDNPEDETPLQNEGGQERAAISTEGKVNAVQNKAGTFEVRTTKRRARAPQSAGMQFLKKPSEETIAAPKGEKVVPLQSSKLSDLIDRAEFHRAGRTLGDEGKYAGIMQPIIAKKLRKVVGDVPVHIVSDEDFKTLTTTKDDPNGVAAYGYYLSGADHIVIPASTAADPIAMRHTLMHEAVHAAVFKELYVNKFAQAQIGRLLSEVKDHYEGVTGLDSEEDPRAFPVRDLNGMTDPHEFLSEALSNPTFQAMLDRVPLSEEMTRRLRMDEFRSNSVWGGLVTLARQILGLPTRAHSVLEAALATAERLSWARDPAGAREYRAKEYRAQVQANMPEVERRYLPKMNQDEADRETAVRAPEQVAKSTYMDPANVASNAAAAVIQHMPTGGEFKERTFKILTDDQLRQGNENLFGPKDEGNPLRRLTEAIQKMTVSMTHYRDEGDKLTRQMAAMSKKYIGGEFNKFVDLAQRSTMYDLHPDAPLDSGRNAHLSLSKETTKKLAAGKDVEHEAARNIWQARAMHDDLAKQYRALPEDLKALYQSTRDYFQTTQDKLTRSKVDAVLDAVDLPSTVKKSDLADRIMHGGMTDDDEKLFGEKKEMARAIRNAEELRVKKGAYFPLMRHGDYVVTGEHDIETPAGARRIDKNTFEFDTRKEAHDFEVSMAQDKGLHAKSHTAYYDPTTGEKTTAGDISTAGNPVQKWQTRVQAQHMELFDRERDANARVKDLQGMGLKNVVLDKRRLNPGVDYKLSSPQVQALIDGIRRRPGLSDQEKGIMERALVESSLAMRAATSVEQRRLPRRNVAGASDDMIRNIVTYNNSASQYLSRAEFRPQVEKSLSDMRDVVEAQRNSGNPIQSRRVLQEMESRLYGFGSPEYTGKMAPFWKRAMVLSFLKDMASPAHLMLHMTHPLMISGPVLGARHGFGKAYGELARAYRDMGTGTALKEGAQGLVRVARDETSDPTDFIGNFKKRLALTSDGKALNKMLDDLSETGHVHASSGYEVNQLHEYGNMGDRALSRVDAAFREMTGSTESINRVAEAIAAYRMEIAKNNGDHEKAVRYVKDTLANTQGLYSSTNAAPIFRNPALRPFLQFKQFPQMIYHLLASNLYNTFKGETPEIRREAARAFAGVVGTHAAMAGALGLPLELIKAPVMLANAFGITNTNWGDIETEIQKELANAFGPQIGEIVAHGLSRALGPLSVDVHHRLGLASLWTFGEPKSNKPEDTMNWIWSTIGGAPGSLAQNIMAGGQAAMHGDIEKAAENLIPAKAIDDMLKAYRLATEGKPTTRGTAGLPPVGLGPAIVQSLGFTPASVANYGTARYQAGKEMHDQGVQRNALVQGWASAKTPADKAKAMQAISAWNARQPLDRRVTHSALGSAAKKQTGKTELGMPVTKRSKSTLDQYSSTFNVGQ